MSAVTDPRPLRSEDSAGKITLPPPDLTARRSPADRVLVEVPVPLPRRLGAAEASYGVLRAELLAAHVAGDTARERAAAARIARWLAARGRSWGEALVHARRSLELGEDEALRHELSGWLEALGESSAAAEVLEPLVGSVTRDPLETVRLLIHLGVLEARGGNPRAAAAAFARAARLDPGEALASELLGTLGSWAASAVTPAEAAESYVEAAARRLLAQALDAQMEDLLRAFDVDPTSSVAVAALAAALTERGRPLAADEVWRAHATALRASDEKRSRAVHARRRLQARAAGDLARALGAALDEGLDTVFGHEVADFMDDLLLRAGLLEPLVARLEIRAESATRATRGALFEEIARLQAGPLANADRAALARTLALEADPTRDDTLSALHAHATETRDATELVEALVRVVLAPEETVAATVRAAAARSLGVIADESLADPMLSAWSSGAAGIAESAEAGSGDGGRADALAAARAERDRLKKWLGEADEADRAEALRMLAGLLRSCPDEGEFNGRVLAELVERFPAERRWYVEAVRLAFRRHDYAEVVRLARSVRERSAAPLQDVVDAALTEATARRDMNDVSGANETTRILVIKAPDDPRALAVAWMNASLAGDRETRSVAIELLAKFAGASVRAVLYAVAAEARASIGDREAPRRLAERACHTDPSSARAVGTLADATVGAHDRTAASALERAIHFLFARSAWCRGLAEALDAMGESAYAVGWSQRLVALRPGDRKAMAALLERVARTRDGQRLAEALAWVLSQPQPAAALADLVVAPLRDLVAIDAARAAAVAHRALDAFGARLPGLRQAILAAADAAGDESLGLMALEKAVAVEDARTELSLLLALRERQQRAGDAEGEARTLLTLARSASESVTLADVEALAAVPLSEDGELARLEALALVVSAGRPSGSADQPQAARAWRDLGAAQWDLAGDQEGALQSLWRAAAFDGSRGFTTLAFDLAQLGGAAYALDCLDARVHDEASDPRAALMAAQTARVALALGEPSRAFDFAVTALSRNPKMAEALEIAESAAAASGRVVELTRTYDELTVRALGRFARRAVNYRAARFFEQQSDDGLALKHAARAFSAVPSEGAALLLLIRTAERAGDRAQAVAAMVQVAETARDHGARFGWLLRAANAAGSDEQGLALRVDVLLHALTVSRDPRASVALQRAAEHLLVAAPDERASLELRLGRASKTVTAKADGPEGARLALSFARMALELFRDARWGAEALVSALTADADLEDYGALEPYALALAEGGDTDALFAIAVRPYTNVGVAAFRLLAHIADLRGEGARAADLWSRAAAREPEDAALVRIADAALREFGDDAAWARFRKASPDAERATMFHAHATERLRDGAIDDALRWLERAAQLATPDERVVIEQELRAAYDASGQAGRVEERALAAAEDESLGAGLRADRWMEIAQLREARNDIDGAIAAVQSSNALDGAHAERWSTLERLAGVASRDDVRLAALERLSELLPLESRMVAWKRLARAREARDEFREAEVVWRKVAQADPDDEEADHAIEALISALRNYADLASHLERRTARLAKVPGAREALRAVRLRRAAILEQRLGRTRDACAELALVLDESPDNVSALSYLADLHERLGEFGSAAPIWQRVALLSRDPATESELELRAGRAAMAARDFRTALVCAKGVLSREPERRDAVELRASAARALREDDELGDALEELAALVVDDPRLQSEALIEASHAAARMGRDRTALRRAAEAARVAPERAATQLLARSIEYRMRGAGTADEARKTLADLERVAEELSHGEAATLAFLRAEALDAAGDPAEGAGLSALREQESTFGPHPLVSLGLAERLLVRGDVSGALPLLELALQGDLGGLRDRGRVAFLAAETAIRAGLEDRALGLLQDAAGSAAVRTQALLKAAQLFHARGDGARARAILGELATSTSGDERARALAQLARLERESGDPADRVRAQQTFDQALAAVAPGTPLADQLAAERDALGPSTQKGGWIRGLEAPSYALAGPPSMRVDASAASRAQPEADPIRARPLSVPAPPSLSPVVATDPISIADLERSLATMETAERRAAARLALARAYLDAGAQEAAITCLEAGLEEGSSDAGDVLASLYQSSVRNSELVRVRRKLVVLAPGDYGRLEALRSAASADRNAAYAQALDHVAGLFEPGVRAAAPSAPPLVAQTMLPGFLAFLTRSMSDRIAQALALVWEDGHTAWGKDPTGALQGTQPAATTSAEVSRIYETAIALLGLARVPLFVRAADAPAAPGVSLTWPPAAVLVGRLREDGPALRFALGQALAMTLPFNILTLGLPASDARNVFRAVMGAFGPPESSRAMSKESGRLAEALWHVLPPRTQRRLQALLASASLADFDGVPGRAWQTAHRIGMFLAGDLGAAVTGVLAASSHAEGAAAPEHGPDWMALCLENTSVADLFQLAVSPEYAEARWQTPPPASVRFPSNRPSVV
jgi:hypothetical protein